MTTTSSDPTGPELVPTAIAFIVGVGLGVSLVLSAVSTQLGAVDVAGFDSPVELVLAVGLLGLFVLKMGLVTLYQLFAFVDQ